MTDAVPEAKLDLHWPERPMRHWSNGLLALAPAVYFLFPKVAFAGTETQASRIATAVIVLCAAVALRPRSASARTALQRAAVIAAVSTAAAFAPFVHAPWIAWMWAVFAAHLALAFVVGPVWRRAFPPAPEHEETATDIVESIATAFVLALIVREFAFEAFKIPTGSMEPTILGEHGVSGGGRTMGDHLIAAKGPLYFQEPKRWSIVVFKYPLFRPTNFIKRLVGLPGERLENRDGDIYIDGTIVAKPEEVQESLWFPVLPAQHGGERPGGLGAEFTSDGGGEWRFAEDGATGTAKAGRTAWIVRPTTQPAKGDVRVSFDVDPSQLGAAGAVRIRLDGAGRRVDLEAGRDAVWLTAPGVERTRLDVAALGSSVSRLGFAVADRVVRVYRDGRLAARVETADQATIEGRANQVWIGVDDGTAVIADVKLERDLQYEGGGTWQIPKDCFFMLGDNTGSSQDSRKWQARVFRTKDGHEYVADSEVRLDDDRKTTNIRETDTAFEFHDSYGAFRHLEKADLAEGTGRREDLPYVKRADIVGRAFLIFLPATPKPGWRPRILP